MATTDHDDPWTSPRANSSALSKPAEDGASTDDGHEYSDEELAGPFCSCGDFGCPGGDRPSECRERFPVATGFFPEDWTDEDIDRYEFEFVIDGALLDNCDDARVAAQRLNELATTA